MVKKNLVKAGYDILVLNQCWMTAARDTAEKLQVNSTSFPKSLSGLSNELKERGITLGAVLSASSGKSCKSWPTSFGFEHADVKQLNNWGVRYI